MKERAPADTSRILAELQPKYVWWEPIGGEPHSAIRVIAQVMDVGDYFDMERLARDVGDDRLRETLANAQPGWFSPRSWAFWHYRLRMIAPEDDVPPLPTRSFL